MPALVNISVGSSLTTIGAEGTMTCPFDLKKSKNCWRISFEDIIWQPPYVGYRLGKDKLGTYENPDDKCSDALVGIETYIVSDQDAEQTVWSVLLNCKCRHVILWLRPG